MSKKKITYCDNLKASAQNYSKYINDHIEAVQEAYVTAIDAFKEVFPNVYNGITDIRLKHILEKHDKSKFDNDEFPYYMLRFFPYEGINPDSKLTKDNFQIAWLHHVHSNPHHPAHWVLANDGELKIFDMPDIYIIEMLCDWMAMSKYYNSTTLEYWKSESAQKLPMSDYTKSKVNEFMEWMYKNNVHTLW